MKKLALGLAVLLVGAGCVVQSLYPWLSAETRVAEPTLLGGWHDAREQHAAFFAETTNASDFAYSVLLVQKQNEISRFSANLHRIDDTLLLVVGPEERQDLGRYATRPGHLLFKAELDGGALKLYGVALESFEARAATSGMSFLPVSSTNEKPSVLAGPTAAVEAFVRAQLADPEFFEATPLYSFRKLLAANP